MQWINHEWTRIDTNSEGKSGNRQAEIRSSLDDSQSQVLLWLTSFVFIRGSLNCPGLSWNQAVVGASVLAILALGIAGKQAPTTIDRADPAG